LLQTVCHATTERDYIIDYMLLLTAQTHNNAFFIEQMMRYRHKTKLPLIHC